MAAKSPAERQLVIVEASWAVGTDGGLAVETVMEIGVEVSVSAANQRMQVMYQSDMLGTVHVDDILISRFSIGRSARDAMLNLNKPEIVAANEKAMAADFWRRRRLKTSRSNS